MLILTLLISFAFFLLIGVPVAFVLGLTPFIAFFSEGEIPHMLAAQRIFTGMDNYFHTGICFGRVRVFFIFAVLP